MYFRSFCACARPSVLDARSSSLDRAERPRRTVRKRTYYIVRSMYSSRNAANSRVRQPKARLGLTGVGLTGAEAREWSARHADRTAPAPPSPVPCMEPPSLSVDHRGGLQPDPAEEYARRQQEQTKAQLQSITGRMFQVCAIIGCLELE